MLRRQYSAHRRGITVGLYTAFLASVGVRVYRNSFAGSDAQVPRRKHVAVDRAFLAQLRRFLSIAFPRYLSPESLFLVCQALLLGVRTYLSLVVARLDGQITAHLVNGDGRRFLKGIGFWLAIGVPASVVNAAIQYVQSSLALRLRANLTNYCLDEYLGEHQDPVYYRIQMKSSVNVGQLMVADTAKACNALPQLFSNFAKPLLDVCVYTYELAQSIGGDNVFFLGIVIQQSARILRRAAPPFGEFTATEAGLEGDFRQGHSRLIEFAEEVAFYSGDRPEKQRLDLVFGKIVAHADRILSARLDYSSLEDFIMKYCWGAAGLVLCCVPIFGGHVDQAHAAQNYVLNRKLLLLSSDAIARLMSSFKEVSSLAGIVARVTDFVDMLEAPSEQPRRGEMEISDYVEFSNVPIVSPAGEVLVNDLTFKITRGHHLLIVGPNGSGKSSLFRVLSSVWPLVAGKVVRPAEHDMFYIPQRPYLSRGSLRQQIIYPDVEAIDSRSGKKRIDEKSEKPGDQELVDILKLLSLDSLVSELDEVKEWRDELSIGAQQKIAAARLFYHKPMFAILDECTASVTIDAETTIYTHAKALGISLITVSHRASLWKYHDRILQFDGTGGYRFGVLDPEKRLALEEEKLRLDEALRQAENMKQRLAVLEAEKAKRRPAELKEVSV